jgi:hypothetical protein
MFTLKTALAELQDDLDPASTTNLSQTEADGLGPALMAELDAARRAGGRVAVSSSAADSVFRDAERRAERSIVATLLDFPLPVPASVWRTAATSAKGGEASGGGVEDIDMESAGLKGGGAVSGVSTRA